MATSGRVVSVNVARAREIEIGGRAVLTAFGKRAVVGRVQVRALGLAGDEQADPSAHGGPAKAVYAYPSEHYRFWQTVRAQAGVAAWDEPLAPGALGENLTLVGLLESQVWIGDVLRFPDCDLAVSAPRMPDAGLDSALGFAQASRLMAQSAWCGFYLAVRRPGTLCAGQGFDLIAGPREVGIVELFEVRRGKKR